METDPEIVQPERESEDEEPDTEHEDQDSNDSSSNDELTSCDEEDDECVFTKYLEKLVKREDIKHIYDDIHKDEPISASDLSRTIYDNMISLITPSHSHTPSQDPNLPSTSTHSPTQQGILAALHDISSKLQHFNSHIPALPNNTNVADTQHVARQIAHWSSLFISMFPNSTPLTSASSMPPPSSASLQSSSAPLPQLPAPSPQVPAPQVPAPSPQVPAPQVPAPAPQVPAPAPHVPAPSPQVPAPHVPAPQVQAPAPQVPAPHVPAPQVPALAPQVPAPSPQVPAPQVPAPSLQLPAPLPQLPTPSPPLPAPLTQAPSPPLPAPLPSSSNQIDQQTLKVFNEHGANYSTAQDWLLNLHIPRNVACLQEIKELWENGAKNCPPLREWTPKMRRPGGKTNHSSIFNQRKKVYLTFQECNFDEDQVYQNYREVKPGKLYKILSSKGH